MAEAEREAQRVSKLPWLPQRRVRQESNPSLCLQGPSHRWAAFDQEVPSWIGVESMRFEGLFFVRWGGMEGEVLCP